MSHANELLIKNKLHNNDDDDVTTSEAGRAGAAGVRGSASSEWLDAEELLWKLWKDPPLAFLPICLLGMRRAVLCGWKGGCAEW